MEAVDWPARRVSRRVEPKTVAFLFLMVMAGSLGSVFLRVGMRHDVIHATFRLPILFQEFHGLVFSDYVWLGVLCRVVSGVAFMLLLSWADYSYVNPAASSAYIVTVVFGWLLLGEVVPTGRWIGTLLITLGVLLVGLTPANTTGKTGAGEPGTGTESPTPN